MKLKIHKQCDLKNPGTFFLVGDGLTETLDEEQLGEIKITREVQVTPISDKACGERVFEDKRSVDEWLVCYGDGVSAGACDGDKGGPSYMGTIPKFWFQIDSRLIFILYLVKP